MILIDAGPLVALISASDRHHASCRTAFANIEEPVSTVWPALTEASGAVGILSLTADDAPRMHELIEQYHDLPMDLADAALVRVAEREKIRRIFTLDRRDFTIYRPAGIGRFSILPTARG